MRTGRTVTAIVGGAALALGLAGPALASGPTQDGGTVVATVTVGQSITLSGLSTAVNWGTVAAGTSATQTGAENITVSTDDPHGYSLQISPNSGGLGALDDSAITIVQPAGSYAPGSYTLQNGVPTVLGTDNGPTNGDNYVQNWTVNVPADAPTGVQSGNYGLYAFAN